MPPDALAGNNFGLGEGYRFYWRGQDADTTRAIGWRSRLMRDEHKRLACTQAIYDIEGPVRIFPLRRLPVIKDLVVDLTHIVAQHELVRPWLETKTPPPDQERLQRASVASGLPLMQSRDVQACLA